jgi:hypothetical protein
MEFYSGKYGKDRRRVVGDFGQFDTNAYATGDILSSNAVAFGPVARAVGMSGNVVRIMMKETATSGSIQKPALRLWLFGSAIVPAARNAAQAFTGTQLDAFLGTVSFLNTDWIDCASNVASVEKTIDLPFVLQTNSSTLYLVPEVRAAYTFNSTGRIVAQIVVETD